MLAKGTFSYQCKIKMWKKELFADSRYLSSFSPRYLQMVWFWNLLQLYQYTIALLIQLLISLSQETVRNKLQVSRVIH